MSPFQARRGTRGPDRKAGLTASLVGILVVVAALALVSRLVPAQLAAFQHHSMTTPHFRSLAGLGVLLGDLGHTTLRMIAATVVGALLGACLALAAAKTPPVRGAVLTALGGMHMVPLLCLLPFLHLLGFEVSAIGITALCLAAPIASAALGAWSTIPRALDEAARGLGLTSWQRLWRLEAPYAIPDCVTALARTMPLAWSLLMAAEMLPVNGTLPTRPGLGTHAAQAAALGSFWECLLAAGLIGVLAFLYDSCLVFPWQIWADRYRLRPVFEHIADPWMLKLWRRTRLLKIAGEHMRRCLAWLGDMPIGRRGFRPSGATHTASPLIGLSSLAFALLIVMGFFYRHHALGLHDLVVVAEQSLVSALRMTLVLLLALALWLPLGVWLGLTARRAEIARMVTRFLALYPKNILFPLLCLGLTLLGLSRFVWPLVLCFFFIQWLLLAQILRGMRSFPVDLLQAAQNMQIRGWLWWRKIILPGIAPILLEAVSAASMTGWTILILAERSSWALHGEDGGGIGAYVARAIENGDLPRVVLGAAVITLCIALGEFMVWHPIRLQIRRRIPSSLSPPAK
ncbi:ABC transporter permease subunit [Asaia sp. As-1742]|uniref:ABC transporter permease subunit n=1 Tax=Asaia sp. As-1742 TaxID=2608325 RepID=UPI0014237BD6|nr:ABC transporter permease subunit [Asaia sp. As-1742]NIE79853.1 ABC transporter permease subunit [Asaia sp. As-1742]